MGTISAWFGLIAGILTCGIWCGSASFDLSNTPNITTIFSRVTGGNVSNIDGLIQTLNSNNPVNLVYHKIQHRKLRAMSTTGYAYALGLIFAISLHTAKLAQSRHKYQHQEKLLSKQLPGIAMPKAKLS